MACSRCAGSGWICEEHPWRPHPHDACSGPGITCPECNPEDQRPPLPDEWIPDEWISVASRSGATQPGNLREHVWTLRKNGRRVDCELRFHGESYGWECQCRYEGELAYGQRFVLHELALEEAEAQRRRLRGEGWTDESPES